MTFRDNKTNGKRDNESFGEWVRRIRTARGETQKQLGEAMYVSQEAVSRLESGSLAPSQDMAIAFSNATGIAIDEVLIGAGLISKDDIKVYYRSPTATGSTLIEKLDRLSQADREFAIDLCMSVVAAIEKRRVIEGRESERLAVSLTKLRGEAAAAEKLATTVRAASGSISTKDLTAVVEAIKRRSETGRGPSIEVTWDDEDDKTRRRGEITADNEDG